jgi:fused signal recognition particle receptor
VSKALIFLFIALFVAAVGAGFVLATRRRSQQARPEPATVRPAPEAVRPATRSEPTAGWGMADRIRSLFSGGVGERTWRDLEDAMIRADVGPKGAADVVARVRAAYRPPADPAKVVTDEVAGLFAGDGPWNPPDPTEGRPAVVMVVGVNGTGKTTTVGKLAKLLRGRGLSVALAAGDTFRAAAGEQLETWANRSGAYLIAQGRGADPGAVAFDGYTAAKARGTDVLVVDTAGRLHTKNPLMDELTKIERVLEKAAGRPVDQVLLVLDATTGQNGISQARAFTGAVAVTGLILTKMDGSARGGIVLAVREELGVPVVLIGTGEGIDDLEPFDPDAFARRLIS